MRDYPDTFSKCASQAVNLQQGYAVKGAFEIATARYLIEPLQAIRDPRVRLVSIQAAAVEGVERSEKTKTKIKFSHCNLVLAGLNEGNVQSISWRYVILDEAWQRD